MWKRLAAAIASSVIASSCQTSMYKPIICEPGTALKEGRCQRVKPIIKVPTPARPQTEARTPQRLIFAPPRQNVYGLPQ